MNYEIGATYHYGVRMPETLATCKPVPTKWFSSNKAEPRVALATEAIIRLKRCAIAFDLEVPKSPEHLELGNISITKM